IALDRVADIKNKVSIGDNQTPEQRERVLDLVAEFADVFALSLSEVLLVDFAELKFDILPGLSFLKRAGQKRLPELQCDALYCTVDELEAAGTVERV
ncbi:hypothetical protein BDV93DRAFT_396050, partial [Ceratobasidium sp. AG-I]